MCRVYVCVLKGRKTTHMPNIIMVKWILHMWQKGKKSKEKKKKKEKKIKQTHILFAKIDK